MPYSSKNFIDALAILEMFMVYIWLDLQKNDSSQLRLEYSMQPTCWESDGFCYILQPVLCFHLIFLDKNIYIHTCYIGVHSLKYFQSVNHTHCKVRG